MQTGGTWHTVHRTKGCGHVTLTYDERTVLGLGPAGRLAREFSFFLFFNLKGVYLLGVIIAMAKENMKVAKVTPFSPLTLSASCKN